MSVNMHFDFIILTFTTQIVYLNICISSFATSGDITNYEMRLMNPGYMHYLLAGSYCSGDPRTIKDC